MHAFSSVSIYVRVTLFQFGVSRVVARKRSLKLTQLVDSIKLYALDSFIPRTFIVVSGLFA